MNIPQSIKNPFSKRARAALNACARFCNNLCMGFGIRFKPVNGAFSISIDQSQLRTWLKDEKFIRSGASEVEDAAASQSADKATVQDSILAKDHWDAGVFTDVDGNVVLSDPNDSSSAPKRTGVSFYAVTRSKKVTDTDYLFFRKVSVNADGLVTAMSAEEFAVAVADECVLNYL